MNQLKRLIPILAYILAFLLPWQTKLILRPSFSNYTEISLYAWEIVLLILVFAFLAFLIISRVWKNFYSFKKIPAYFWILAVWELFTLVSIFGAGDKFLALNYYFLFLLALGLFFIITNRELAVSRFRLALSLIVSLSLQAALAIAQFLLQTSWACKYLGLSYHNPAVFGTSVIETISGRWLRAYGGFDHPNILGGVLVFGLLLAAYYIINLPGREPVRETRKKLSNRWRATGIFWLFYLLGLGALTFSFSRSAFLALGAGFLVYGLFYLQAKQKFEFQKLLALAFISVLLVTAISWPFKEIWTSRVLMNNRLEVKSLDERQEYALQAAQMIKARPWLGVGRGNYVEQVATFDPYPQPVHNVFILSWAEIGVFGFLALAAWLFYSLKKSGRSEISAAFLIVLVILMFFDHWLFSLPFGLVFFWLIFGFIW